MTPNAFIGRTKTPTETDVAAALGPAKALWDLVLKDMAQELGLTEREWKCAGHKYGWSLRLKKAKRNIVHLSPCQGCFRVAFILGDRAVSAARAGKLGARAAKLIYEAPRYPEGTGIRLEAVRSRDLRLIKKLTRIKLAH
jgi:Protein of unknown function (DUF3788)